MSFTLLIVSKRQRESIITRVCQKADLNGPLLSFTPPTISSQPVRPCSGLPIETGLLNEVSVTSGIRYTFFQKNKLFLKPYVQLEAHYTYEDFSGLHEDIAIIPGPFPFDMRFQTAGTIVKAGVKLFLLEKVTLSCLSSFRWGVGTSRNAIFTGQPRMALRFASSPVEMRVGVRFRRRRRIKRLCCFYLSDYEFTNEGNQFVNSWQFSDGPCDE